MNVRKHGISTSSFPISQHCKITALMEPKRTKKKSTTTIRFKDIFGRKGLLISKTYHDITLSYMFPLTTHTVFAHARVTLLSFLWNAPWDMSAITETVTSLTIVQMSFCDGGWRLESLMLMGIRQASEESALSSGGWMKWWVLGVEERHRAPLVQESRSRPARQPKAVHILIH